MINKIYNCISIHNGGGIVYLSMMHNEIDKKGNFTHYFAPETLFSEFNLKLHEEICENQHKVTSTTKN